MKKVMVDSDDHTVALDTLGSDKVIFAKRDGKLKGMVIYEERDGWTTKIGAMTGLSGHYKDRKECMMDGIRYGVEYFIED